MARRVVSRLGAMSAADLSPESARLVDACAGAWDVLDDLAYRDWSQIDQSRARVWLERIIEASDAVTPRPTADKA